MDPKWQALWFGIALVLFLFAALFPAVVTRADKRRDFSVRGINFVALGLFFFTLVFFWTAWRAA